MKMEHIKGINKGKIILYALSTCMWCKKTKELLDSISVEYNFVYVDLLEGDELKETKEEIMKYNPRCSFPTVVINNEMCIVGFKEDKIKEALNL